jgi:hypothetical protein
MSKGVAKILDPLKIGVQNWVKDDPPSTEAAPAAAAPAEDPGNKDVETRVQTTQFKAREQLLSSRAAAAGVTRSDNEADLLGYKVPKAKRASRTLLG